MTGPRVVARLAYGAALVLAPERTALALTGRGLGRRGRVVARVLGVRHLVQGASLALHHGAGLRRAGRWADLLHACSMVLLAVLIPGQERIALTDAVIEVALAGSSAVPAGDPAAGSRPALPRLDPADLGEPERARERRRHEAALQKAIYAAYQCSAGRHPQETAAALASALEERGLAPPPGTWCGAVAAELAEGNLYVVSGRALDDSGIAVWRGRPV